MNDIGKIAHVLKHSHGRCVISSFDKILYVPSTWSEVMEDKLYKSSMTSPKRAFM